MFQWQGRPKGKPGVASSCFLHRPAKKHAKQLGTLFAGIENTVIHFRIEISGIPFVQEVHLAVVFE
jgi:hypothetical protein